MAGATPAMQFIPPFASLFGEGRRCRSVGCEKICWWRYFKRNRIYSDYCRKHTCHCKDPKNGVFCFHEVLMGKGYCSWHERCWVTECMRTPDSPSHLHPKGLPPKIIPQPNGPFYCDQHNSSCAASNLSCSTSSTSPISISATDGEAPLLSNTVSRGLFPRTTQQRPRSFADLRSYQHEIVGAAQAPQAIGNDSPSPNSAPTGRGGLFQGPSISEDGIAAPRTCEVFMCQSRLLKRNARYCWDHVCLSAPCLCLRKVKGKAEDGRGEEYFSFCYYHCGKCTFLDCAAPRDPALGLFCGGNECLKKKGSDTPPSLPNPKTAQCFVDIRRSKSTQPESETRRAERIETSQFPKPAPLRPLRWTSVAPSESIRTQPITGTPAAPKNRPSLFSRAAAFRASDLTARDVSENPWSLSKTWLFSGPQFFSGPISNSQHWMRRIDCMNQAIHNSHKGRPRGNRPRIAILDTGCDPGAQCIMALDDGERRLSGRWEDWVAGSADPVDQDDDKHGTALAALTLRIATHADVFVGRIARNVAELKGSTKNIVKAIFHAASVWQVDIISMSFGFPGSVSEIHDAISEVQASRRREGKAILFFSAANNEGLNEGETFPASDENVISVRGTNHLGAFEQAYNPAPWPRDEGALRLGTLATNVPYDRSDTGSEKSGCSLATPILASAAAAIIYDIDRLTGDDEDGPFIRRRLRTRDGMTHVMARIARFSADRSLQVYVAPWKFVENKNEKSRLSLVRAALEELEPLHDAS